MCPLYVAGLIGPGNRKNVQPMAERLAPGDYDHILSPLASGTQRHSMADEAAVSKMMEIAGYGDITFKRVDARCWSEKQSRTP